MDNGVIERGSPVPVGELLEAACLLEVNCVVTPDVLGDAPATKKLVMDQGHLISRDFPLMRIPQGACVADLFSCIDWLNTRLAPNSGDPSYWGVPRWIANRMGSRTPVIDYINEICPRARIHLLGMSHNLLDDQHCLRLPNVTGIDSANPIVIGIHGISMRRGIWQHMDRGSYWEEEILLPVAAENVEFMHNVVRS